MLIADEVGLGKTISAIYIWKELQARGDTRRLLVICPAALKDKWRYELLKRFGIEAQPVDANALSKDVEITLRDPLHSFVRIGSLEGLRSRQLDEGDELRTPRQRLMRQLQDHPAGDFSLFDLVIVDEAHAARNADTANYHFVEAVRDAAASLVMLTATPLQTHSENLFNLLRLVDPDRFVSLETFEQARRANIPIIESLNALLRTPPDCEGFRLHLEAASREPLLRHDKLLRELADTLSLDWSEAQRRFVNEARMKRNVNGYTFADPVTGEELELRFFLAGGGAESGWCRAALSLDPKANPAFYGIKKLRFETVKRSAGFRGTELPRFVIALGLTTLPDDLEHASQLLPSKIEKKPPLPRAGRGEGHHQG